MQLRLIIAAMCLCFILGAVVVTRPQSQKPVGLAALSEPVRKFRDEAIRPLPGAPASSPEKFALGRKLFHEERLSVDGSVSCASCHNLSEGGDDGRRVSVGVGGQLGIRNSPTVFNAVYNFRQFWDGRAASLMEQLEGPLFTEVEMGWSNWDALLGSLNAEPDLVAEFSRVYGEPISRRNLIDALVEFERALVTPGAPFDLWLEGDDKALTEEELAGYELFKHVGCIACHQGKNVGGNMFQTIRSVEWMESEGGQGPLGSKSAPAGTAEFEGGSSHLKVPSLRNVELTAPYLHDGSSEELADVIQFMAVNQLGSELEPHELASIERFLKTLTAPLPERVIR